MNGDAHLTKAKVSTLPLSDQSDIVQTATLQQQAATIAVDEHLKTLARAMGRQAAQRHMARGRSIVEIGLMLAVFAIIIGFIMLARR